MSGTWLGIDTTSSAGGVSLLKDGVLIVERLLPTGSAYSEKLLQAVEDILEGAAVSGAELSGVGVSIGPGSYTGIRIGIATALGLSSGWGVPVKGVPTLRVLAFSLPRGEVLSCIRARKGEVFAGVFTSPDPSSKEIIPQSLYSAPVFEKLVGDRLFPAVGSGRTEIALAGLRWVSSLLDYPRPSVVAACAELLAAREGFDRETEPLYLREFNQRIQ